MLAFNYFNKHYFLKKCNRAFQLCRYASTHFNEKHAFVGSFIEVKDKEPVLTKASHYLNHNFSDQILSEAKLQFEESNDGHIFIKRVEVNNTILFVTIAKRKELKDNADFNKLKQNIRESVAKSVLYLQNSFKWCQHVLVDPCEDAEAAAEGAYLSAFVYDELKKEDNQKNKLKFDVYVDGDPDVDKTLESWNRGVYLAEGQNLARKLMETPANIMTPTRFSEVALDILDSYPEFSVQVYDEKWIKEQKMEAFLAVAKGSVELPKFLEIEYKGNPSSEKHIALVGKGITFDSGGISIKQSLNMDHMRGDMGGGAVVLGTMHSLTRLKPKCNVKAYIPLCENMPDANATKPGDVVTSKKGLTIQIDNTDAEGRLILADGLAYADSFNPACIISVATLTGAMKFSLGGAYAGLFARSDQSTQQYCDLLKSAGEYCGDPVWQLPMAIPSFVKAVRTSHLADVNNITTIGAGSSTAATFLNEFVREDLPYLHLDIAGVMYNSDELPYLRKGMTGRPTRSLIQFITSLTDI